MGTGGPGLLWPEPPARHSFNFEPDGVEVGDAALLPYLRQNDDRCRSRAGCRSTAAVAAPALRYAVLSPRCQLRPRRLTAMRPFHLEAGQTS